MPRDVQKKNASSSKIRIERSWSWNLTGPQFDDHVREQLPWYDQATGVAASFVRAFLPKGGRVVDVGAATGNIGRAIAGLLVERDAVLWAIEPSDHLDYDGPGVIMRSDVLDLNFEKPDVIVCFLTLMFVPVEARPSLLFRMREAVRRGGAVIVFDKFVGRPGYLGTAMARLTLEGKAAAGVDGADMLAKELSLSGVQRPLMFEELESFTRVWQYGDFAGLVYAKA